jgi:hypothetical protein
MALLADLTKAFLGHFLQIAKKATIIIVMSAEDNWVPHRTDFRAI